MSLISKSARILANQQGTEAADRAEGPVALQAENPRADHTCTALQEICLRVGFANDIRLRRQRNPGWQNFVGAPIGTLPL